MKKNAENADRVDREAFERERERLLREREVIAEMSSERSEEMPETNAEGKSCEE